MLAQSLHRALHVYSCVAKLVYSTNPFNQFDHKREKWALITEYPSSQLLFLQSHNLTKIWQRSSQLSSGFICQRDILYYKNVQTKTGFGSFFDCLWINACVLAALPESG